MDVIVVAVIVKVLMKILRQILSQLLQKACSAQLHVMVLAAITGTKLGEPSLVKHSSLYMGVIVQAAHASEIVLKVNAVLKTMLVMDTVTTRTIIADAIGMMETAVRR
jgi:hypothetical protein